MMTLLDFIIWAPNPDIFTIPVVDHPVRWYGLLFAAAFIVGQQIMIYIYHKEGNDVKEVEKLTIYVIAATIIGARLGHCLFYDPIFYLTHPLKLIAVWEGGLASHGGAIGLFIALYLFARKYKREYLWVLDRVAIITVVAGAFIRFGNYMNSEIIGIPTQSESGIVFARNMKEVMIALDDNIEDVQFVKGGKITTDSVGLVPMTVVLEYKRGAIINPMEQRIFIESTFPKAIYRYSELWKHFYQDLDEKVVYDIEEKNNVKTANIYVLGVPRHPAQLYEAIACVIMFLLLAHIWYYHRDQVKTGFIFGVFMTLLWAERFGDEFFKEVQESWEAALPINMGQILSIPMFLAGVFILIKTWGKKG